MTILTLNEQIKQAKQLHLAIKLSLKSLHVKHETLKSLLVRDEEKHTLFVEEQRQWVPALFITGVNPGNLTREEAENAVRTLRKALPQLVSTRFNIMTNLSLAAKDVKEYFEKYLNNQISLTETQIKNTERKLVRYENTIAELESHKEDKND